MESKNKKTHDSTSARKTRKQQKRSYLSVLRWQRGRLHVPLHPMRLLHQLSKLLLEKLAVVSLLGLLGGWRLLLLLLEIVNERLLPLSCCQR